MSKVSAVEESKRICVTQVKSLIRCIERQRRCLLGLGLGKIGERVVLKDNLCVRGLIKKVSHLVRVVDSNE